MNIFSKKLFASPVWAIVLAASVLSFASCTKDDDENDKVAEDVVTAETFSGKMEVTYKDSAYVTDNVTIDILNVAYTDSVKKTDGTFDMVLNAVKFVPMMPALDITVPSVTFKVTGENKAEISGEGIIPIAMKQEFEMYKVSGFEGTITYNNLSDKTDDAFKFKLTFGQYPLSYSGSYVDNSI
jgi:hypothetical protein